MKTKFKGICIRDDDGQIQVDTTYKAKRIAKKFGKNNITNMKRAISWLNNQKFLIDVGQHKEDNQSTNNRLKEQLLIPTLREKYKELIFNMFPNIPKEQLYRFTIIVKNPHINIFFNDEKGKVLFTGVSKCSPEDRWDEFTGVALALTRLRININSYVKVQKEKNNHSWIPDVGEIYYTPFLHGSRFDKALTASCHNWQDLPVDFIRLSLGNIYRTKREAIKAGKRMVYEGKRSVKEGRNARN